MAKFRGRSAGWAAGWGLVTVAAAVQAQDVGAGFAIAAGPAARAIPEFARQAHLNVLAATEDLAGITTNEVRGRLRPDEALARLLAGTPLVPHVKDNGSILITTASPGSAPTAAAAAGPAAGGTAYLQGVG